MHPGLGIGILGVLRICRQRSPNNWIATLWHVRSECRRSVLTRAARRRHKADIFQSCTGETCDIIGELRGPLEYSIRELEPDGLNSKRILRHPMCDPDPSQIKSFPDTLQLIGTIATSTLFACHLDVSSASLLAQLPLAQHA